MAEYFYYDENGNVVFTELYLVEMLVCCGNGCKNCPYEPKSVFGTTEIKDEFKHLKKITNDGRL